MTLSLIAAVAENGVIGLDGDMPWRLPADLRRFRRVTMGKPVIMGRRTYESIGHMLPGRTMIVVTRQSNYDAGDATTAPSLEHALELTRDADEAFVIGGENLFRLALPLADRFYQTVVHATPEGDTFFPEWNQAEWRLVEEVHHPADEKNSAACTFRVWERSGRSNSTALS
ncbi:MAG: dihydrofolate reductase [Planctomycetes bacterium]|nr:dihydrofolate reductase [Planctomycetota bacterium]